METHQIVQQFFEEAIVNQPKLFGSGHINDTYQFSVNRGEKELNYILQRINHEVFKEPGKVMENIQVIADYLSTNNSQSINIYPKKVLAPVLTLDGQSFFKDPRQNFWRIFPFFENTYAVDSVETDEQAFLAACAFGEYLNALKDFPLQKLHITIPDFHNGLLRLEKFKRIIKIASKKRLLQAKTEIDTVLKHQSIFPKVAALHLPLRVTHNDTKINNLLFDQKSHQPVAVIDLDTVMPGIVLSDFGDMVRTFTNSGEEDERDVSKIEMRRNIYEALNEGFQTEMKDLSKLERAHLFDGAKWIVLMQAVRFLTDFLEGDVYYKTSYAEHNLVRTKNQLALFNSMR